MFLDLFLFGFRTILPVRLIFILSTARTFRFLVHSAAIYAFFLLLALLFRLFLFWGVFLFTRSFLSDCASRYLPHLVGLSLNFNVDVRVITWCILWINQAKTVFRQSLLDNVRVESNAITMLLSAHTFVRALCLLLFLFISDFPLFGFPMLNRHLYYVECIFQKLSLNLFIRLCIRVEARRVINLYHPRFQVCIQHDIEAQQLKAAIGLFLLARPVDVLQLGLDSQHGLNDNTFDFLPDFLGGADSWTTTWLLGLLSHGALQYFADEKFVLLTIKTCIFFV